MARKIQAVIYKTKEKKEQTDKENSVKISSVGYNVIFSSSSTDMPLFGSALDAQVL